MATIETLSLSKLDMLARVLPLRDIMKYPKLRWSRIALSDNPSLTIDFMALTRTIDNFRHGWHPIRLAKRGLLVSWLRYNDRLFTDERNVRLTTRGRIINRRDLSECIESEYDRVLIDFRLGNSLSGCWLRRGETPPLPCYDEETCWTVMYGEEGSEDTPEIEALLGRCQSSADIGIYLTRYAHPQVIIENPGWRWEWDHVLYNERLNEDLEQCWLHHRPNPVWPDDLSDENEIRFEKESRSVSVRGSKSLLELGGMTLSLDYIDLNTNVTHAEVIRYFRACRANARCTFETMSEMSTFGDYLNFPNYPWPWRRIFGGVTMSNIYRIDGFFLRRNIVRPRWDWLQLGNIPKITLSELLMFGLLRPSPVRLTMNFMDLVVHTVPT